jgi:hypothetical protein
MKEKRTQVRTTIEEKRWKQLRHLAGFKEVEVEILLDEAVKMRIESEKSKGE